MFILFRRKKEDKENSPIYFEYTTYTAATINQNIGSDCHINNSDTV